MVNGMPAKASWKASDIPRRGNLFIAGLNATEAFLEEGGSNLSVSKCCPIARCRKLSVLDIYIFSRLSAWDYRPDAQLRRRLKEVTQECRLISGSNAGTIV